VYPKKVNVGLPVKPPGGEEGRRGVNLSQAPLSSMWLLEAFRDLQPENHVRYPDAPVKFSLWKSWPTASILDLPKYGNRPETWWTPPGWTLPCQIKNTGIDAVLIWWWNLKDVLMWDCDVQMCYLIFLIILYLFFGLCFVVLYPFISPFLLYCILKVLSCEFVIYIYTKKLNNKIKLKIHLLPLDFKRWFWMKVKRWVKWWEAALIE